MPTTDPESKPQATRLATSPNNMSATVSSPLTPGNHGHYTSRPSSRAGVSQKPQVQTPRPAMSRNANSHLLDQAETSPNYFNLTIDSSKSCQSSGGGTHARANFSPPSSRVRSTAAISPRIIPLDQNPEFEAFRRQSDLQNLKNNFNISLPSTLPALTANAPAVQLSPAWNPTPGSTSVPRSTYFAEEKPRSPKRSLPSPYSNITDRPRRTSPAAFTEREAEVAPISQRVIRGENCHSTLPSTTSQPPPPSFGIRAETLPPSGESSDSSDEILFSSPSHIATLLEAFEDQILLLDLRVSTQYARSQIQGALNLCIPTTLLKRVAYNTRKLAETFKHPEQRSKFERWRSCKYIVVYDANASRPKDGLTCVNMLKKFKTEGWAGTSHIMRGGFQEFSKQFPNFIHYDAGSSSGTDSESTSTGVAPVIGGCPMPVTKNAANPFFGNIRQNMDLIGGVGQIPLKRTRSMGSPQAQEMPKWLRLASDEGDQGKLIADKFLAIEREEQRRMQEALSDKVSFTNSEHPSDGFKIAGIEKGNKNRYNNIWPFEHSRVKLQGIRDGGCDYINANFVKSAWSHKRYIATQGPIPATFTVSALCLTI
jgi:tyrosine-protein phosphatase 2/3